MKGDQNVNCKMACCAMSNVLGAITQPPNGNLVNGSFGNLVIETSTLHIAQQAISQLTLGDHIAAPGKLLR